MAAVATTRELRTNMNAYIVNLAVCDFLLLALVLPFNLYTQIMNGWQLNDWLCTFIGFLGYTLTGKISLRVLKIFYQVHRFCIKYTRCFFLFLLSRECLSYDTTYIRMSARTFESML